MKEFQKDMRCWSTWAKFSFTPTDGMVLSHRLTVELLVRYTTLASGERRGNELMPSQS